MGNLGKTITTQQGTAKPPPITARKVTFLPVRSDEAAMTLNTFQNGEFTIFVPLKVRATDVEEVIDPNVHIFFGAGGVDDSTQVNGKPHGNGVAVHGLRGASNNSDWITIAVHGGTNTKGHPISDAQIDDCLKSVGVRSPLAALRLSGHSRGAISLLETLTSKKITRINLIDRVHFLDEGVKRVATLTAKGIGIPAAKIVCYEVNSHSIDPVTKASSRVTGARYLVLDPASMAAVGCARLIGDAAALDPAVKQALLAMPPSAGPTKPNVADQLALFLMPARGGFSALGSGGEDLKAYGKKHAAVVKTVTTSINTPGATANTSMLAFVNAKDLARELDAQPNGTPIAFKFSAGIAAHHFFVAEIAHELTS